MTGTKDVKFFCGNEALSEWLKEKRQEKGLTMEDISIRLGLAPGSYSVIDCGDRRPSAEHVETLGPLYGVDPLVIQSWILANSKLQGAVMRELFRRFMGKSDKKVDNLTLQDVERALHGDYGDRDPDAEVSGE